MKKLYTYLAISALSITGLSGFAQQQDFNNFEGSKAASLAEWNGQIDSAHAVPSPNTVNSSSLCAKYVRSTSAYDNFKFFPFGKLIDVTPYADNSVSAPKMTMKVFTSAPVGTSINLQLGVRSNTTYPAGVHSEYTAMTSAQNAWHTVTFSYSQSPPGSMASATSIDKVVLFFKPNSTTVDTLYFDDFTGPAINIAGVPALSAGPGYGLWQNSPNPAHGSMHIDLDLTQAGPITLKVYDMLGNSVATLLEGNFDPGHYSVPFEASSLSNGIYFYELKNNSSSRVMKMTVAN